jgi:phosphoribosylanthranilate isomerase
VLRVYRALHDAGLTIILQCHDESFPVVDAFIESLGKNCGRTHVLFDASRGKGVLPKEWPSPWRATGRQCLYGYAGGLGPNNLASALPAIKAAAQRNGKTPYWIDMESGVRTDNAFDFDKVRHVISVARSFAE